MRAIERTRHDASGTDTRVELLLGRAAAQRLPLGRISKLHDDKGTLHVTSSKTLPPYEQLVWHQLWGSFNECRVVFWHTEGLQPYAEIHE